MKRTQLFSQGLRVFGAGLVGAAGIGAQCAGPTGIVESSGAILLSELPPSLAEGALESDEAAFVFEIPGGCVVDLPDLGLSLPQSGSEFILGFAEDGSYGPADDSKAMSVPVSEPLGCWVVHADPVGPGGPIEPIVTSLTFGAGEEVLGVSVLGSRPTTSLQQQTVGVEADAELTQLLVVTTPARRKGISFSIDAQSAMLGAPASFPAGAVLDEGDVLTVGVPTVGLNPPRAITPIPQPGELIDGSALGALLTFELDALSYGRDRGRYLRFSVDEFARGVPGIVGPNVYTEGAFGAREASADVFSWLGSLGSALVGNHQVIDGDAYGPILRPGLGLIDTNPPTPGFPDLGDNLDALDVDTRPGHLLGPVFFSLDGTFADPLEPGANFGSAAAHGFSGGDVLVYDPTTGIVSVYASASALGLVPGDDVDALALRDDDLSQPEFEQFADKIHFSLRRNSPTIRAGMTDCALGEPIEPGDVLIPCRTGPGVEIVVRAEDLGLNTQRSNEVADDLDALDRVKQQAPLPVGGPVPN